MLKSVFALCALFTTLACNNTSTPAGGGGSGNRGGSGPDASVGGASSRGGANSGSSLGGDDAGDGTHDGGASASGGATGGDGSDGGSSASGAAGAGGAGGTSGSTTGGSGGGSNASTGLLDLPNYDVSAYLVRNDPPYDDLNGPRGIAVRGDRLVLSQPQRNIVAEIDMDGQTFVDHTTLLSRPTGVAFDLDDTIVAATDLGARIVRILGTDDAEELANGLPSPEDVVVGESGTMYVCLPSTLRTLTPNGDGTYDAEVLSGDQSFGCAVDATETYLYFTNVTRHTLSRIATSGGTSEALVDNGGGYTDGPADVAQFARPSDLSFLDDTILVIADEQNHCIRAFDTETLVADTLAGTCGTSGDAEGPALQAQFNRPVDVAVHEDGRLFVVEAGRHRVRVLTPTE